MINFIKGNLSGAFNGTVVVENNGIGYQIHVPDNSRIYKIHENEEVKIYTALIVREDDMSLYGFDGLDELEMFRLLTTVNGIGAKAAMAILSSMSLEKIKMAILYEDVLALTKANGIGKKTAQRIVLELKDKVGKIESDKNEIQDISSDVDIPLGVREEALEALISLGYSKFEAKEAISKINVQDETVESLIKLALKKL